jgi:hypothetical protein
VLAPAGSLLVTRAVLESAAPRLNDRRSERLRGGRSNRRREPSALSKSGWSTILADPTPGRRYLRFAGRAENWKFRVSPTHGKGRAVVRPWRRGLAHRLTPTVGGEPRSATCAGTGRKPVEQGCLATPTVKGSRFQGRCRIPSLHSRRRAASSRAATMPLFARSPVRAAFCPAGASRHMRRLGEGGAACGA